MENQISHSGLKPFNELYQLNIKKYVKKKPTFFKDKATGKMKKTTPDKWLDYLEWAAVVKLLYANGATKVRTGSERTESGYPAFFQDGKNPFVRVWVEIDGDRFEIDYPVIDGSSANSSPNQLTIHKAQQRAFVKAVAINTGLGLNLWEKDEAIFEDAVEQADSIKNRQLNDKIVATFSELVKKHGDADDVHSKLGTTKRTLTALTQSDNIASKEAMLDQMAKL